MIINSKIKQAVSGNWGKPKGAGQGVKLRKIEIEPPRIPNKKKKRVKKSDNPPVFDRFCCPFCHNELPVDHAYIATLKNTIKVKSVGIFPGWYRVKDCPKCKAKGGQECPACKRETWYRTGWYKHQGHGCGFEGKKK